MVELARGEIYPVLPLRDIVVFPHMIVPLFVGREKSVRALEDVMREDKQILLVTQKDAGLDDPAVEDLYEIGTVATVLQLLKLPDGTVKVLVEGGKRAEITGYVDNPEFFQAYGSVREDSDEDDSELEALARSVVTQFEQYIKLNKKIPPEVLVSVNQIEEPAKLADTVASHLSLKISEKQELLETKLVGDRLERIFGFMESEIGVLQVEKKIRNRVKRQMEKTQREYYLNEQLKAIQKELGEGEDGKDEASELEEKLNKAKMPKEAKEKAQAELKKLRNMSPMSAEATVVRNYLDWMVSIPWNKRSRVSHDLKKAKKVLDKEHYGLEKVKERILEYLAVQARTKKVKGPILCLVGPPGVGKTSLGKSMANATGRSFVRMSLGGVRDESEIRGHRRTYIGSMPGKIVQGMKKAKYSNPLFLLDEIEKMGSDFRGDPASALLEVLDPEQNSTFNDHYLEVDYDLSDVMFVTTANSLRMQQPLLDRMEVIRISGYTEDEKVEIAKRHLIPKQVKDNGLKKGEWSISDDALRDLIRYYTREAGVRSLERELAKLARKATKRIMLESLKTVRVTPRTLGKYAGVRKFRFGETEGEDQVGVVTGLAYTEFGGDLLQIEAVTVPGKGNMKTTGKLGEVMTESIQAATSFVRSRAVDFGIKPTLFQKRDIHVHVPEGATPKDGPSAGVGMVTSVVSVLTGNPVRKDVAMTGEVTLRGRVLAIGGLKEKLLAALRGGVKTVLIPQENEKDLEEIPDNVKRGMEIIPVSHVDEVLSHALANPLVPIEWEEEVDDVAVKSKDGEESDIGGVTTH
ncbi:MULTISPECIES: endopeptidase La [Thalassospira]|jgi:ATP-dependent Lon protease|uniref:Lon protease n=1 Tax=Thalassospira profundimaris TaxID=502049 RepID=A0A367V2Y1_9PROT|nr:MULTISPECIES: endopeptidase La [Thalassospira]MBR9899955.1 endopeptidase La [Rhodospirillales bacterium]KZB72756.1 DNA-binding protein [Thalassospira sp. MCCC 1A01148]MBO6807054.1 endopeptidase La [Thalassospira sp.]MBO6841474.1 endopeptidase La [Thalassospira sp.]MBS8272976.1 endopeptidase La [Thalassospira tepidiphila]|tara:strand:+ start:5424 stop:7835 length:2412 start_codon:yes stop_codon:yes gene_type:complete